jgi:hypothetical protein
MFQSSSSYRLYRRLYGYTNNDFRFQVNSVFHLISQMPAAILYLCDEGTRIMRMCPVIIGSLSDRFQSTRASSSFVGIAIPDSLTGFVRNSWQLSPVSRRTML